MMMMKSRRMGIHKLTGHPFVSRERCSAAVRGECDLLCRSDIMVASRRSYTHCMRQHASRGASKDHTHTRTHKHTDHNENITSYTHTRMATNDNDVNFAI